MSVNFTTAFSRRIEKVDGRFINQRTKGTMAMLPPRLPIATAEQRGKIPGDPVRQGIE
jgi:hypothetical protein